MSPKQRAAEAALPYIRDGMIIGLGTGSTADFFLQALAREIDSGHFKKIVGVPTSLQSEHRAIELGIPLSTLARHPLLDLTIDGADEVAPNLDLIKGLGGALVREKIVAQNSQRLIIIADAGKRVDKLGRKAPLPIEVVPFAYESQERFLKSLGAQPVLRKVGSMVFHTDNGNLIFDCHFPDGLDDPAGVDLRIRERAGILGCGLFLGMADIVLVADDQQVTTLNRK